MFELIVVTERREWKADNVSQADREAELLCHVSREMSSLKSLFSSTPHADSRAATRARLAAHLFGTCQPRH